MTFCSKTAASLRPERHFVYQSQISVVSNMHSLVLGLHKAEGGFRTAAGSFALQ